MNQKPHNFETNKETQSKKHNNEDFPVKFVLSANQSHLKFSLNHLLKYKDEKKLYYWNLAHNISTWHMTILLIVNSNIPEEFQKFRTQQLLVQSKISSRTRGEFSQKTRHTNLDFVLTINIAWI